MIKVVFTPGCFDSFEGTQEELDDLIGSIKEKFMNGDFLNDPTLTKISETEIQDKNHVRVVH